VCADETAEERTLIGQSGNKYDFLILGGPGCHSI